MKRSAAEKETVLQWDGKSRQVCAWTTDPVEARHWIHWQWPVEVAGTHPKTGEPSAWTATVPRRCIGYRRPKPSRAVGDANRKRARERRNARIQESTVGKKEGTIDRCPR
jgi:hypothetical protein